MLVIYGCYVLLFTLYAKVSTILNLDFLYLEALIFCVLNTLIAWEAFAKSLEHWQASRVSTVLALAPIMTLSSTWLISTIALTLISLSRVTSMGILGAFLVVGSSITIALSKDN